MNNSTTIILILILMMMSSMVSSSASIVGFNLFTGIIPSFGSSTKPEPQTQQYINDQEKRTDKLAKEIGVDKEKLRQTVEEELRKTCLIYPDEEKTCPTGTKLESDGCCQFVDPKQEKMDIAGFIGEVALAIIVGMMVETMLIAGGTIALTYVSKAAAVRFAAAVSAKLATRVAASTMAKMYLKFQVASKCGPPCIAAIIAFELMSMLLDFSNAMGYDNFIENAVVRQSRNASEVQLQKALVEEGGTVPLVFTPLVAYPEYGEEATQKLMGEFLPDTLELMNKDSMVKFLVATMNADEKVSDEIMNEFEVAYETAMKNIQKRDDTLYKFYASKGKRGEIERIPFMSSQTNVGIGLTQKACKKYNDRMKEKHILYANPFAQPPDEIPKDYAPYVASYTDTYRVLNTENPGEEGNPNVIEKKLSQKVSLLMPWGTLVAFCEHGMRAENIMNSKVAQRLNPAVYGVRFNTERGDCDFTNDYCKRLALKLKNNECVMRPGQEGAEWLFGKTITRAFITDWDNRIEAWKSGDAGSVALATVTLPIFFATPFFQMADDAVKDTYGRGVGTPMICGPDKERKGELCYPRCRTGPNGEQLYKSRALECEGICPSGSKNTGFTCLQGIHSFIPSNRSSNPFDAGFYQRADCNRSVNRNSTLGVALLKGNKNAIDAKVVELSKSMLGENLHPREQKRRQRGLRKIAEAPYLEYKFRGTTCNEPCLPGLEFRSGAAGTAFCDKTRGRYSRAGKAKVPNQCPEGKKEDHALCYKLCKPGYRGQGPTCKKSEESKKGNMYTA